MQWELPLAGFLSSEADELVPIILQANERFFALAKDVNQLIMAMVQESLNTVHTSSMADDAVLVRLLMRAAGFYQGALLMAERGMYVECRAMARSVIEVSLAVAAMGGDKATFMQMLRDDHLKSRRNRYPNWPVQRCSSAVYIARCIPLATGAIPVRRACLANVKALNVWETHHAGMDADARLKH